MSFMDETLQKKVFLIILICLTFFRSPATKALCIDMLSTLSLIVHKYYINLIE